MTDQIAHSGAIEQGKEQIAAGLGDPRLARLRIWNIAVGLILAAQAAVIAVLTNGFSLPVTATFMTGPPGSATRLHHLFGVPIGWGVFAFLAISAAALLIIASPGVFGWYKRNLLANRNYGRWIEYSVSSSLMIVLIAMLVGISDIAALIAIFGVNAAMILFGALMEKYEHPGWRSGSAPSPASSPGSASPSTSPAPACRSPHPASSTGSSSRCSSSS
jgi:Heliorhodopsin